MILYKHRRGEVKMAEIGLVHFARVCRSAAEAVVPAHRSKFSKRVFTQPQLLTILCLMRYEDWTFREAEVRLAEHRELRQAIGLKAVPDYTTLYRFLRRLNDSMIRDVLAETSDRLAPESVQDGTILAVDATGLERGSISTFFVKRVKDRGDGFPWQEWLKWIVTVDVPRRLILAQEAKPGSVNDCATLRPLVAEAATLSSVKAVLADAEFDSERNHLFIRQDIGALSAIPAKRGKKTWKIRGCRAQMRKRFPRTLYRQRSLVESIFSAVKRKLSTRAPGRSWMTQRLQALLLGVTYNVYRLKHLFRLLPSLA
jgi:hypothetical protein